MAVQRALQVLLERGDAALLTARLPDGRMALHLAALHGFDDLLSRLLLPKYQALAAQLSVEEHTDVDTADWELKLSALGYAVLFGHEASVRALLGAGASAAKMVVHKDKGAALSI